MQFRDLDSPSTECTLIDWLQLIPSAPQQLHTNLGTDPLLKRHTSGLGGSTRKVVKCGKGWSL